MTPTLWFKLSEDTSLPEVLDAESRKRLQALFDSSDAASAWSEALRELGLSWPGGAVLRWFGDIAYVNGSAMVAMISSGWVQVTRTPEGGFAYSSRTSIAKLPALLKSQWRIENFLSSALDLKSAPPKDGAAQIRESLMLGLAMQALMLRLPKHEPRELAGWLAGSLAPPARIRKIVESLQKIQARRTLLSKAWEELFPASRESSSVTGAAWVWDDQGSTPVAASPTPSSTAPAPGPATTGPWKGLPVHSGRHSGAAWLVDLRNPGAPPASPFIAVFAQARPGAVEHYAGAAALVFAEGGVLSHACAVAREQGIPTVTAAGRSLIQALQANPGAWLTVDGSTGDVELGSKPS